MSVHIEHDQHVIRVIQAQLRHGYASAVHTAHKSLHTTPQPAQEHHSYTNERNTDRCPYVATRSDLTFHGPCPKPFVPYRQPLSVNAKYKGECVVIRALADRSGRIRIDHGVKLTRIHVIMYGTRNKPRKPNLRVTNPPVRNVPCSHSCSPRILCGFPPISPLFPILCP